MLLFKSVLLVIYSICILIKNRRREPGRDVKIISDRMSGIKGSAEHSRWTCVDRPSCSVDKKWAMAKNGSFRCFLAKNGCTLKTIAVETVVGRI